MWSLGVLLYMLIKRKFPFKGETIPVLREKIKHKDPDYTDIEPSILPLLKGLLCKDPKNRFTSQQALNFPWVKTYIETSNLKIDIKIDNKNGITSNGNNILLNTIMTENFEEKILKREQMSAVTSEKPMKIRSSGSDIEFVTPVKQTVCEQLLATGKFRPIQAKHRRQDSLSKLMARYHKRSESLATGELTEIMDNTVNNPNESF
ncbi:hypothetical protein TRFO_08696 [Tritrichomonas foetus]|uniref:Protein kinase domain-containing protein n=1 Tax=Tritrichomonas foetus TaxID=1144522 RepID=A0A1J4JHS3_9EUKA|nr:hypothetical protein TRFO_08696 [Tritrichomonas foetus]|eukprot:OHS98712.1 hypothetical protein TRFO_08696 [Tritrichomonas foetus]